MNVQFPQQPLFQQLLADLTLDAAYEWHAETTHTPVDWTPLKAELRNRLAAGQYAFQPLRRMHTADGPTDRWDDTDCLVLKAMTLVLEGALGQTVSHRVLRRDGDADRAIGIVQSHLAGSPDNWVMQSDLTGACARIDHDILYRQVAALIPGEQYLLRLVWQYIHHAVEDGGEYFDAKRGIDPGCALSPLMAALYLKPLDDLMESKGGCHVRCMNDWVTIFPTRWAAQKAHKEAVAVLAKLGLDDESRRSEGRENPRPTVIVRADKGLDLLGFHLSPVGAVASTAAMKNELPPLRLYAQSPSQARVEQYLACWATEAPNTVMEHTINLASRSRLGWRTQVGLAAGLLTTLPATVSAAVVNWGGGPLDILDALGFPIGTNLNIDGSGGNDMFLIDLAGNLSVSYGAATNIGNPLAAGLQSTTGFVVKSTQAFATFVPVPDPGVDGTYYLPFLGLSSCATCVGYLSLSYAGGNWGLIDAFWNNTPGAPITVGDTPVVPEPAPFGLVLGSAALVALGGISRRRRKSSGADEAAPCGLPVTA